MGCLRAERLDSGETSGSPVSREAYGDGAVIVLNRSGQCLRQGEGPQGYGDARDRAVDAANCKGISGQGRLSSKPREPCARKRASTGSGRGGWKRTERQRAGRLLHSPGAE
jgi:hypothetical protein